MIRSSFVGQMMTFDVIWSQEGVAIIGYCRYYKSRVSLFHMEHIEKWRTAINILKTEHVSIFPAIKIMSSRD